MVGLLLDTRARYATWACPTRSLLRNNNPFTGVLFLKRQWLLGKRFGYITPGEMFSDYYRSDAMRMLTVVVALVFNVPYLGIQLKASGLLFNRLLAGTPIEHMAITSVEGSAIMLSIVVFIYVASAVFVQSPMSTAVHIQPRNHRPRLHRTHLVGGWEAFKSGLARPRSAKPTWSPFRRPESDSYREGGTLFRAQRWRSVDRINDPNLCSP